MRITESRNSNNVELLSTPAPTKQSLGILNGDFEDDDDVTNFKYKVPSGWTRISKGGIVVIKYSATISWNPQTNVNGGQQFVGLQSSGTGIEQSVGPIEPNSNFYLSFDTSYRAVSCAPIVEIYCDNNIVLTLIPTTSWQTLTLATDTLKTDPSGRASIKFINSQSSGIQADCTAFIDNIRVFQNYLPTAAPTISPTLHATQLTKSQAKPHLLEELIIITVFAVVGIFIGSYNHYYYKTKRNKTKHKAKSRQEIEDDHGFEDDPM